MAGGRIQQAAAVGVAEHGNLAVLVTLAPRGARLDRPRIELTGRDLPTHPHHHEGSWAVGRYLNTLEARSARICSKRSGPRRRSRKPGGMAKAEP